MRYNVTIEHFNLNRVLKILQSTINYVVRVGYDNEGNAYLVAKYGTGYLIRNININSTMLNIKELSNLLENKRDKFKQVDTKDIVLLDQILTTNNNITKAVKSFETESNVLLSYESTPRV